MDDFGIVAKEFGLRLDGKSASMSASRSAAAHPSRSGWSAVDSLHEYSDVFGGPPKPRTPPSSFDSILPGFADAPSMPVYDKPVYDDDEFDGVTGVRSAAPDVFDDVFARPVAMGPNRAASPPIDDVLESLGRPERESKRSADGGRVEDLNGFEELIPGFGGSSPPGQREHPQTNHKLLHVPSAKLTTNASDDPFVVFETTSTPTYPSSGLFIDPLNHISMRMNSESTKVNTSSVNEGVFDDTNAFDRLTRSVPVSAMSEKDDLQNECNPSGNVQNMNPGCSDGKEAQQNSSMDPFEHFIPTLQTADDHLESNDILFEKPFKASYSSTSVRRGSVQNSDTNGKVSERDVTTGMSPWSNETNDVWLTVAEVHLFTLPATALPPSRPPPQLVINQAPILKAGHGASVGLDSKRNTSVSFWQSSQSDYFSVRDSESIKTSGVSPVDELENFTMTKSSQPYANEHADIFSNKEEIGTNLDAAASAAAMTEAMARAEAKFRQAREVRDRERDAKSAKLRESAHQEENEKEDLDVHDREDKERQDRLDHELRQREMEEKEKEEKKRERERERELEKERQKARQAVERATREARERAAAGARLKAERAAVEKANAEARQRAERAAVQKVATEARERAAADARERAERAAAEARERAAAEVRERAAAEAREKATAEAQERAAVARAAAEARLRAERAAVERAAAEARERAAVAAREKQYKNENDFESFFGMGAQANSAPRQGSSSTETVFDAHNKVGSDGMRRTAVGSSSTVWRASPATNIVDDLTSIFGAAPSSGEFQEVEGENGERRKARLVRHQRTCDRAAKAVAVKNERDIQAQREQAERHRIAETLDVEIKRWAAGKEGNLRALLSTLQYVLWPECGWQPVSLIDLMLPPSVKKVYRKATLCIHPDKVQQKGANLQQKYIAEKVFDLLKEAWNKFNSEEMN